jgi:hypothetical protein
MSDRDLQNLHPVDLHEYEEGEFVGYYLGVPFDWAISSPELIGD